MALKYSGKNSTKQLSSHSFKSLLKRLLLQLVSTIILLGLLLEHAKTTLKSRLTEFER